MTTPITTDAFIDLVYADPGLLRAEFDAIVVAELPRRRHPPIHRPSGPWPAGGRTGGPKPPPGGPTLHPRDGTVAAPARERAPPDPARPS